MQQRSKQLVIILVITNKYYIINKYKENYTEMVENIQCLGKEKTKPWLEKVDGQRCWGLQLK